MGSNEAVRETTLAAEDVAARVTLRHALTHVSGWPGDLFEDQGPGDDAIRLMVGKMAGLPQLTALGEVWSYNNVGFNLAGRAIEVVTGQSFERAIQTLLHDPLGMDRTFFFAVDAITYRCAVVALDPPAKGNRGEFVRDGAGSITWLRWGGRIHGKAAEAPSP